MTESDKYSARREIKGASNGLGYWGSLGFLAWLSAGALISRIFVVGDLAVQLIIFLFGFVWAVFGPFSLSFFLTEVAGRALYSGNFRLANNIARAGVFVDQAILPLVNLFGVYDTPLAVFNLLNLANSQIMLCDFKGATKNLELALDKSQATFGWDNHLTQMVIGFLAGSCFYLGRFVEAESYLRKSIANKTKLLEEQLEESVGGFELMHTLSSLAMDKYNMAKLEEIRENYDQAEQTYRDCIKTIIDNTEYDTDMLANHMNALGCLLVEVRGNSEEAEDYIIRAMEIRKAIFPRDHALMVNSYQALGYLKFKQGLLAEAEQYLDIAYSISVRAGLSSHPDFARVLRYQAEFLIAKGALTEAEEKFELALSVIEASVGADYFEVAGLLVPYIELCVKQDNKEKAGQLQTRLETLRGCLGLLSEKNSSESG